MRQNNTLHRFLQSNPKLAKSARRHTGLPEVAALLLELRQQLGLSQKEFARKAGLTKTMLSELENAANDGVTLRTLTKLAKGGSLKLNLSFETAEIPSQVGAVTTSLDLSPRKTKASRVAGTTRQPLNASRPLR